MDGRSLHMTLALVKADDSPFKDDQKANYPVEEALPDRSSLVKPLAFYITMTNITNKR